MKKEELGIFKNVDFTDLPILRNSLSNESAGPLPLPTREEIWDLEYPFTEDPMAGSIDTKAY